MHRGLLAKAIADWGEIAFRQRECRLLQSPARKNRTPPSSCEMCVRTEKMDQPRIAEQSFLLQPARRKRNPRRRLRLQGD
ncbi:unnamed protein product [Linum trigynum]|uniref:Uncharacterized protein n=1 Tax=Linum trigynum TaxID=586398 RepID=A0AAV2F3R2_9ROSI